MVIKSKKFIYTGLVIIIIFSVVLISYQTYHSNDVQAFDFLKDESDTFRDLLKESKSEIASLEMEITELKKENAKLLKIIQERYQLLSDLQNQFNTLSKKQRELILTIDQLEEILKKDNQP